MTDKQIYSAIERNKCCLLQINDSAGNTVSLIEAQTAQGAVMQLEELLPDFRGYKKLQIKAVEKKGVNWSKGFCWILEFDKTEEGNTKTSAIGAAPAGSISPLDYITMFKEMMMDNNKLQKELMEKTLAMNNNDPTKWLPIIQTVGPALGFQMGNAGGISGPQPGAAARPKNDLHFIDDIDTSKLTPDQFTQLIGGKLNELAKNISGQQMLQLVVSLEKNVNIKENINKINKLLLHIADKPQLLDMALMQFNLK